MEYSSLIDKLMRALLENGGAEKGYFILVKGGTLSIEAEVCVVEKEIRVMKNRRTGMESVIPMSVINYVMRTGKSLVLEDSFSRDTFLSDSYIIENKPLSILCIPVIMHGDITGILYLENNLVSGAFTPARVAVAELLTSQSSVSLENSMLYRERTQARETMEDQKRFFENLIDGSAVATFVLDVNHRVLIWNRACEELTGYHRSDMLGTDSQWKAFYAEKRPCLADLVLDSDFDSLSRLYPVYSESKLASDSYHAEGWYPNLNGKERYILFDAAPLYDMKGELTAAIETLQDITDSKRIEEALSESEEKYHSVMEASPDAIVIYDKEGRTIYVNPAFTRIFGWPLEEIWGMKIDYVPDENREETERMIKLLMQGNSHSGFETRRRNKNGDILDVNMSFSAWKDMSGEIRGSIIILRDVTAQKKLETYLRQSQKMEAIGTLAGGIAHDFNNILSAVIGYTDILLIDVQDNSKTQEYLKRIKNAGIRATELVRQILTFSRQSANEPRPLQIKLIVTETLKLIRSSLPATIEIKRDFKSESAIVIDPTEVHQIMMNLCTNAKLAMRDGGGTLNVSVIDVDLDAVFTQLHPELNPGHHVMLSVSDTGCGMTPEIQEHIFEPFFTTRAKEEGTGMGLSVVHGIVKKHGGAIEVSSEPGKGTTFNIYFSGIRKKPSEEAAVKEIITGGKEHILFVDDEELLVNIAIEMLGGMGYRVTGMTSSLDALAEFKKNPDSFDLLITDMTMPNITGELFAQQCISIRKDIPVILCTGYSEMINKEIADKIGIREFVIKPIVMKDLAVLIRKVIDGNK